MEQNARVEQQMPATRHNATWNAVASASHFAPALIARGEEQVRMLAEAASMRNVARTRRGDKDPACSAARSQSLPRVSIQLAAALAAAWRLIRPRGHATDAVQLARPAIVRMWR